jgi:protein-L-isoaspartate(D-aspartate) O-methyltransferase
MSARPRPGFPVRLDRPAEAAPRSRAQAAMPPRSSAPAPARDPAAVRQPQGRPMPQGLGLDSQAVRLAMVHKLAAQGIRDARVLEAMGRVERHRFVDTALAPQAYEDTSLPIGLGQTISKPNVVARMIELLLAPHEPRRDGRMGRVLEIGTGCGYQAAVLSLVVQEVYSIERLRGLHEKARENLRHFRLPNVHLLFGDGMEGYARGAPYAGIIAAAGGDAVPQAWIDQLAVGGRLVAPVARAAGTAQALLVLDKTAAGVQHSLLEAVHFVPLKSGIA